jgi:hypothetical protein
MKLSPLLKRFLLKMIECNGRGCRPRGDMRRALKDLISGLFVCSIKTDYNSTFSHGRRD